MLPPFLESDCVISATIPIESGPSISRAYSFIRVGWDSVVSLRMRKEDLVVQDADRHGRVFLAFGSTAIPHGEGGVGENSLQLRAKVSELTRTNGYQRYHSELSSELSHS
mmetsp:Transcript_31622/g.122429  ORF Transcript_31622/g.122429 Transcript_31622/m.122429 type:complete len:110 (+) Transcript_31622:531-860(+)